MIYRPFLLYLLSLSPLLWANDANLSKMEAGCRAKLAANAALAKKTNEELIPSFVRSSLYANTKINPEEFWMLSVDAPKVFQRLLAAKFDDLAQIAGQYQELFSRIEEKPLSEETAKQIVSLESNPRFNEILDEYEAMPSFEDYANANLSPKELLTYNSSKESFRSITQGILKLRSTLRERLVPGKLSQAEAKMLLSLWSKSKKTAELHPDTLADWIIGSDAALKEEPLYLDPKSGHQIGYGATPLATLNETLAKLPLKEGDQILDVGSGWGRVVIAGALMHPQYKFSGVEYVDYRATHAQTQIDTMKIPNAKSFQGDASSAAIEQDLRNSKVLFLFNSFAEPALELFIARTKNIVNNSGEKKYIVAMNEKGFPFPLSSKGFKEIARSTNLSDAEYNNYTIYEINPE